MSFLSYIIHMLFLFTVVNIVNLYFSSCKKYIRIFQTPVSSNRTTRTRHYGTPLFKGYPYCG